MQYLLGIHVDVKDFPLVHGQHPPGMDIVLVEKNTTINSLTQTLL